MNKEQKQQVVLELTEQFKQYPVFYITDTGGMTVAKVNDLRRECFKEQIPMRVAKNTLIKKALEQLEGNYSEVYPHLKSTSSILFATAENAKMPAGLLKKFRRKGDKPTLKVACVESSVFVGDSQIDVLTKLKTKNELIGEVVGLLQSPMQTVLGQLKSGGNTIAGLVKTLSERD